MSETITRFKFFWADQDEQQETWLRAMAQQGLHLDANPIRFSLGFWTFRRGAPADVVYRVNYANDKNDGDFRQLLEDAGWTLAASAFGWQYWRTPAVGDKAPEIFTDAASRSRKFKQLLGVLAASAMPMLMWLLLTDKEHVLEQLSLPFLLMFGALILVYLLLVPYSILRLLLKLRESRSPLSG
jgi:hypothetical protein